MGFRQFISRLYPITGEQLDAATITADKIAADAIVAAGIKDGSVTVNKIGVGAVTNAKLDASAVTEAVTVAKTFTHASLADAAGILGSQLSGSANIAGTQLASNAAIAGTQLAAGAAIAGSQLGVGALHSVKGTVTWNGAATQAIATLPAGALLLNAISVCTATFNGSGPSPAVTVGYTASTAVIITACGLTATNVTGDTYSTLGSDLFSTVKKAKYYASQTVVNGYLTAGGSASTGSLDVYLIYVQTA